jgi:hypothetical protein
MLVALANVAPSRARANRVAVVNFIFIGNTILIERNNNPKGLIFYRQHQEPLRREKSAWPGKLTQTESIYCFTQRRRDTDKAATEQPHQHTVFCAV